MGLGSLLDVSMEEARELLAQYRKLRKQGKNPIRHPPSKTIEEEQSWTFDDCAEAYIDSHALGWSNPKHIDQWRSC